jgi:hypothetical protein
MLKILKRKLNLFSKNPNTFENTFQKISKNSFTIKFEPLKQRSTGPLNTNLSFAEISDKMKNIIDFYTKEKRLYESDQNFLVNNLRFYKDPKRSELKIIAEMLAYTDTFIIKDSTNKEKNLKERNDKESDNSRGVVPSGNFNIFYSFREMLKFKIKHDVIGIEDLSDIFLAYKKVKNCNTKFFYGLSDTLDIITKKIMKSEDKKYSIGYLETRIPQMKNLLNLPFGKQKIGNLINFILKKEVNSKRSLSEEFSKFITSFYYEYDQDVYVKYILVNKKMNNIPEDNLTSTFTTNLFSIKDLFAKNMGERIKTMSQLEINQVDVNLSNLIEKLYFTSTSKDYEKFEKINKFYLQFLTLEHMNMFEVKYFPKFIESTTKILNDYKEKIKSNNDELKESLLEIKNVLEFCSKFYVEFKHYLFIENLELQNIFIEFHNTYFYYLNLLEPIKVNWNIFDRKESDFIYCTFNILSLNSMNNIKNQNTENFIINNFNETTISNLDKNTFPQVKQFHKIVYKIITMLQNLEQSHKRDEALKAHLKLFSKSFEEHREVDSFFINLTSIIYHCLLSDFKDTNTLDTLLQQLVNMIKNFGFRDMRFLSRLILICHNLKISQTDLYEKYKNILSEIEEGYSNFNYQVPMLWWDKKNYNQNKYEVSEVEKVLKEMYQKSSLTPVFENTYYSDFKINEINVDFIGPYNILNTQDLSNLSSLSTKYQRKKLILEKANQKFITVPYLEILNDLNKINKYV